MATLGAEIVIFSDLLDRLFPPNNRVSSKLEPEKVAVSASNVDPMKGIEQRKQLIQEVEEARTSFYRELSHHGNDPLARILLDARDQFRV